MSRFVGVDAKLMSWGHEFFFGGGSLSSANAGGTVFNEKARGFPPSLRFEVFGWVQVFFSYFVWFFFRVFHGLGSRA